MVNNNYFIMFNFRRLSHFKQYLLLNSKNKHLKKYIVI